MYLLDTDILINLSHRSPSPILRNRLVSVPAQLQFTSSITVGELYYGAFRVEARDPEAISKIENEVLANLPVLPFDTSSAQLYGEIRAGLARAGTPIGDSDIRIAAIALAHGLTVVTGNVRHFSRVPELLVENWFRP